MPAPETLLVLLLLLLSFLLGRLAVAENDYFFVVFEQIGSLAFLGMLEWYI